jgi:hypothetical protein
VCARVTTQRPCGKSTDLKNRPKDTFWRLQNAFLRRFLGKYGLNGNCFIQYTDRSSEQFSLFGCACRCCEFRCSRFIPKSAMPCLVFGEHAAEVRFRRMGRRCPLEALNTPPLPISRIQCSRFRANDATAFTQTGNVVLAGFKETAQDAFLRAQDALVRLFLRFSGCAPMWLGNH